MANFNEIKSTVFSALGIAADKTRKVAAKAADKAKDVSRITKLTVEIKSANDAVEKTYTEIGRLYYETRKSDPDDFFVQLCQEVTAHFESINDMQSELDELKLNIKGSGDSDIEVEVAEVKVKSEESTSEVSEADFVSADDNSGECADDKPADCDSCCDN